MFNNQYMETALKLAKKAADLGEIPVGAVIVDSLSGKIISKAYNLCESKKNPTYHAEMLAITRATKKLKSKYLTNCDIYVTLEPCAMCAQAISFSKIQKLYYGAQDYKMGAVESVVNLYTLPICYHKPQVYSGISQVKSANIIKEFFIKLRK